MSVVRIEQRSGTRHIAGQSLRLLLVQILHDTRRTLTMPELIAACESEGVIFTSRASKLVSDTLRWEMRKKRVVRVARGRYRFGSMPRSTMWWLGQKMTILRASLRDLVAADRARPVAETVRRSAEDSPRHVGRKPHGLPPPLS